MPRIAAPARRRRRRFTLWLVGRLLYYFPRCGFVEPAMSRAYRGLCVVVLLAVGGCGNVETKEESYHNPKFDPDAAAAKNGSVFGAGGIDLLGGGWRRGRTDVALQIP